MPIVMRFGFLLLLLIISVATKTKARNPDSLNVGVNTSIRALQVVNDSVLWFGGNKGWLGRSTDGGRSWKRWQPAGELADFRTLHAIDELNAIAATTTRPANVVRTHDGGKTWRLVFHSRDTSVFLDGMAFWNEKDGVLFGDPINNRLFLMRTTDSGHSWTPFHYVEQPQFEPGEACFAASGTSIQAIGDSTLVIVSGGSVSNFWYSTNRGKSWIRSKTPLQQGLPSMGAFSVAVSPDSHYVVVGGDYTAENLAVGQIGLLNFGTWWIPRTPTRGYREAVAIVDTFTWIATGPSGSDVTFNGGLDWQALNDVKGMHTVQKSRTGQIVYLAGNRGVILRYDKILPPIIPDWQPKSSYGIALRNRNIKPFEKEIKRIVKKYGKAKTKGGEVDYKFAAQKVASEIQQLEGIDSIYVSDPCIYGQFSDETKVRPFLILHLRLRTNNTIEQYCLKLENGKYYKMINMRELLGLNVYSNKLSNPEFYECRDYERIQRIICTQAAWGSALNYNGPR